MLCDYKNIANVVASGIDIDSTSELVSKGNTKYNLNVFEKCILLHPFCHHNNSKLLDIN
jgi:hypothetical protein